MKILDFIKYKRRLALATKSDDWAKFPLKLRVDWIGNVYTVINFPQEIDEQITDIDYSLMYGGDVPKHIPLNDGTVIDTKRFLYAKSAVSQITHMLAEHGLFEMFYVDYSRILEPGTDAMLLVFKPFSQIFTVRNFFWLLGSPLLVYLGVKAYHWIKPMIFK